MKIVIELPRGTKQAIDIGVINQVLTNKVWDAIRHGIPFDELTEPRMVIYESDGYADGAPVYDMAICPACNYRYEDYESAWGESFCPNCGQALIWKREEEGE